MKYSILCILSFKPVSNQASFLLHFQQLLCAMIWSSSFPTYHYCWHYLLDATRLEESELPIGGLELRKGGGWMTTNQSSYFPNHPLFRFPFRLSFLFGNRCPTLNSCILSKGLHVALSKKFGLVGWGLKFCTFVQLSAILSHTTID